MSDNKIVNKRIVSNQEYLDALQDRYSKLCVVRVDLGYKKPHSDDITLDDANSDFNRMLNNRRGKPSVFKHQVGYICKKEYTKEKGMHFHTIFFYDGQKVKSDVKRAIDLGTYWNKQITNMKGSYYNCNLNAEENYGDKNAVGMLDYRDVKKRENLDTAVSYLCKDDHQDIKPVKSNHKDRAFVRGIIPTSKGKIGRPRK